MVLFIILLTAVINIILGILSYKKDPKSATTRFLAFLTFIFAAWSVANYFSLNSDTAEKTLFWIRTVMFITAPMGPVLYLFIKAFPGRELKVRKTIVYALAFLTLGVMSLAYTPFLFSGVSFENGIQPKAEFGIFLYAFLLMVVPLFALIELIRKYRKTSGIERLQLRYLVFGTVLTFSLLILTNFLMVLIFNYSQLVIFGPMFSLIFVGFIFYAIVKHRLLQVRLIIARSVAFTLLVTILATIYSVGVSLLNNYLFSSIGGSQQPVAAAILAIFIVFTFEPLKVLIFRVTDKVFFQAYYRSDEVMLELTTLLASTITLKELTKKILDKLLTTLRLEQSMFIIFRKQNKYSLIYEGFEKKPVLLKDHLQKLLEQKRLLIAEEETNKQLKTILQRNKIQIVIPLLEHDQTEGLLLLGDKKSGEIYTPQDIKLLEIIGPIVTIAIQNAKAYDEIKRFNKTLTDKVELATKELQVSHQKLQNIDKQKDQFIGMASHELKTPITSIKAFTQVLMQKALTEKNVDYAHLLKNINNQIDRITNLINDLLNVNNIEAGRLVLKKKAIDFDSFVRSTVTSLQYTTDKHTLLIEGKTSNNVTVDQDRIEQVISNLITNAIKYSPESKKIIVKLSQTNNQVKVAVTDFGPGIPKEEQPLIFERFYRTRKQELTNVTGFGLGLYISAEIIKKHQGKIWVDSVEGEGATFNFILPRTT